MKERLMMYWEGLSERERWMLSVSFLCVATWFYFSIFYFPIRNLLIEKQNQLIEKQKVLLLMQKAKGYLNNNLQHKILAVDDRLSLIDKALKQPQFHGFAYQLQQAKNGGIELSFAAVPYPVLMTWLWELHQQYAFSVEQVVMEETKTLGVVRSSMVITIKEVAA